MVGVTWKGGRSRQSLSSNTVAASVNTPDSSAAVTRAEEHPPTATAPSFRDLAEYKDLFRPLPKPEAIPALSPVKIDAKSWRQLQDEREAMVNAEIERTRQEAEQMWRRAQEEDNRRSQGIQTERDRIEQEQRAREEILMREQRERDLKNKARREEINRQEALLSGRQQRARTLDPRATVTDGPVAGGSGIQIYHYKDPVVADIVKQTRQQELHRRASQPNTAFTATSQPRQDSQPPAPTTSAVHPGLPRPSGVGQPQSLQTAPTVPPASLYRNVMEGKEFFKVGVVARSQSSSSSTTSR